MLQFVGCQLKEKGQTLVCIRTKCRLTKGKGRTNDLWFQILFDRAHRRLDPLYQIVSTWQWSKACYGELSASRKTYLGLEKVQIVCLCSHQVAVSAQSVLLAITGCTFVLSVLYGISLGPTAS